MNTKTPIELLRGVAAKLASQVEPALQAVIEMCDREGKALHEDMWNK
jgi:hypothetical protein